MFKYYVLPGTARSVDCLPPGLAVHIRCTASVKIKKKTIKIGRTASYDKVLCKTLGNKKKMLI